MANTPSARAVATRKRTAIACARKLEAAANALLAHMHACNACDDASATLERQGKGIDGRSKLLRDMQEFAGHLDSTFGSDF